MRLEEETDPEMLREAVLILREENKQLRVELTFLNGKIDKFLLALTCKDQALDGFMWRKWKGSFEECRECDVLKGTEHLDFCKSGAALNAGRER